MKQKDFDFIQHKFEQAQPPLPDGLRAECLLSGRFNYEFVCCLSKRIPRVYLKNGKIISQTDYF